MNIEQELNHKQYLAASSQAKHLRIVAGAGTGKTRTLTYRLAYQILCGINPKRMVAITFTNKAAKEMLTRVEALLEREQVTKTSKPLICTFHAFCYRFLRQEITAISGFDKNFQIADEENTAEIYKSIFKKMPKGDSKDYCKYVTSKISSLKTEGIFPMDVTRSDIPMGALYTLDELLFVYQEYQRQLRIQNLLDFDDLLMLTVYLMKSNEEIREHWRQKYDVFLVDEFQDTNSLQYEMVKLFMKKDTSLTVVGDPDQTIYTWRGAKNEIIKDRLQEDFSDLETVVLDENYRSTQNILDVANALIQHNKNRLKKDLIAKSDESGAPVEYFRETDNNQEAYQVARRIQTLIKNGVDYNQIAVIYRSNYLSRALESQLTKFKIPYEVYGGMKFYERAEIKDAISYLRVAINPDDFSFKRILKAPSKGIGDVTLDKAMMMKEQLGEETTLFDVFLSHREDLSLNKKSKLALDLFFSAYERFLLALQKADSGEAILTAINLYYSETGFLDYVHREDVKNSEKMSFLAASSTSKVDNVNEFLKTISDFFQSDVLSDEGTPVHPTLEEFLIQVALQSDQDALEGQKKVALMTGHVSKGLEFPYVFVTGLNQTIFPTNHAILEHNFEEERRLLYVCMTRAQKQLTLSSFGGRNFMTGDEYHPSMFLKEIPIQQKEPRALETRSPFERYHPYQGSNKPNFSNAQAFLNQHKAAPQATVDNNYHVGDRVIHASFGKGVITKIIDKKLTVDFGPEYGIKVLVIGFKAFRKMREDE